MIGALAVPAVASTPISEPVSDGTFRLHPRRRLSPGSPLEQLREADLALVAALQRRVPDWSPEALVVRSRVNELLAGILDYEGIARRALGSAWDTLTSSQRAAFLDAFSALTNRAFVTAATVRNASFRYDSETVIGPEASVLLTVTFPERAGEAPERIEYRMTLLHGRWLIRDVLFDRTSLVDSYRSEFARLLQSGGFHDLLGQLRQKLARTAASY